MNNTFISLHNQIAATESDLRVIQELKSEYVQKTDIPLHLIKAERQLETRLADLRSRQAQLRNVPCPYRGLKYFDTEHAANYFGRAAMVKKLVDKLDETNFVALVGSSGSGKSSLVRAGLITTLHNGALDKSQEWLVRIFRPDSDPFFSLAVVLFGLAYPDADLAERAERGREWARRLMSNELNLCDLLRLLKEQNPYLSCLLLVADPFEEIFTLCEDETICQHFLSSLLAAVTLPWCKVLFTLRADFYGRVLEHEELSHEVDKGLVNIIPMNADERRTAIEQPTLRVGGHFEDGLVERILDDVEQAPGQLPLLEFALTELWERQSANGLLTHATYSQIGGVAGAITCRADEILRSFRPDEQVQVRTIFTRLVRVAQSDEGTDTRQRIQLKELNANLLPLVNRLADARLLVTSRDERNGEETVEVVHEALIRNWRELQTWLNADREFLLWRQRLRGLMTVWEVNQQDGSALLRGALLSESEQWLRARPDHLNRAEQDFIATSQATAEANRQREVARIRLRRLSWALALLVLLAVITIYFVWQQRQISEANRVVAVYAQQTAIAAQATADSQRSDAVQARETAVAATAASEELRRFIRADQLAQTALVLDNQGGWPQRNLLLAAEAAVGVSSPPPSTLETLHTLLHHNNGRFATRHKESPVTSVVFSPDGRWLASGSSDMVQLSEVDRLDTGPIVLSDGYESTSSVVFSPDGKWLAVGSQDDAIRLWAVDQPQAKPIVLQGHEGNVISVAFSPDGKWLASGGEDSTVRLWAVDQPQAKPIVLQGHEGYVELIMFSPDSKWLASGIWEGAIRLWAVDQPQAKPIVLQGHEGNVTSVAFSPDGKWLAVGSEEGAIRLWAVDQPQAKPIVLQGHEGYFSSVVFSPDGKWLAVGSQDDAIRLWAVDQPQAKPIVLQGHEGNVISVVFSPDGKWLASGGEDSTVRLWAVDQPQAKPIVLQGHEDSISSVVFSSDGKWLAAGSDDSTVRLWAVNQPQVEPVALQGSDYIQVLSVVFSADGEWLAAGAGATVQMWAVDQLQAAPIILQSQEEGASSILLNAFSPDGKWLAGGGSDSTVRLWAVDQPQAAPIVLQVYGSNALSMVFSPDSKWLAIACWDGTVRLWKVDQSQADPIIILQAYEGNASSMVFSPDGKWLAVGVGPAVRLWAVDQPQSNLITIQGHEGNVTSVVFSPDGKWLASGSEDSTIRLWAVDQPQAKPIVLQGHEDSISSVVFSPDGKWLASGSWDSTVRLWAIDQPQSDPIILQGHEGSVSSVVFSPDGKWLSSVSGAGILRMWAVNQIHSKPVMVQIDNYTAVYSPDGKWLAQGSDNIVLLWAVLPEQVLDLACQTVGRNLTQTEWEQYFPGESYRETCSPSPL